MKTERHNILFSIEKSMHSLNVVIPIIHFMLTFLWERKVFVFSEPYTDMMVRENHFLNNLGESVLVYIMSKTIALVLIFLLWKLVFGIINNRIQVSALHLFEVIFIAGIIVGLFFFPSMMAMEVDNWGNYASAIRFWPTYWHSIFTGALYGGCVMALPHPFSLFFFQWLSFVTVIAYIFYGIEKHYSSKNWKYFSLLFFFLPENYQIVFNPYRNNYYTVLCLFYFSYIVFSHLDVTRKEFHIKEGIVIAVLSAFIMVWRSEGMLVGAFGMLYLFVFVYQYSIKKTLSIIVVLLFVLLILNKVSNVGNEKYYGRDYMIVNTPNVLYNIFNDPNINIEYEGAQEDLAAINAVTPLEILQQYGLYGARCYNYEQRGDIVRTLADDETADEYMRAYYRIVIHNFTNYMNYQTNVFFSALQIKADKPTYSYTGEDYMELKPFPFTFTPAEMKYFKDSLGTTAWENNRLRILLYSILNGLFILWCDLWKDSGINGILHSLAIIWDIGIIFVESYYLIRKKNLEHAGRLLLFLIPLGELASIFLFMPEPREQYLYPPLYTSYLLLLIYIIKIYQSKAVH